MLDIQTLNCTHILTYTIYITAASYMTVLGLTDLDQPCAFEPYFNTWNSRLAGIYRRNEKNRNLKLSPHSYNYYYCRPPPKKKNPSPGNYRKDIWLNTENNRGDRQRWCWRDRQGPDQELCAPRLKIWTISLGLWSQPPENLKDYWMPQTVRERYNFEKFYKWAGDWDVRGRKV